MALTLEQHLKASRDEFAGGIIENLLLYSDVMKEIPWVTKAALSVTSTRVKTLSTASFRKINGAYAESTGTLEQLQEAMYALGGDIDVDIRYTEDGNAIRDPRQLQIEIKLLAIAYKFNDYFINGDQASDPDGFTGIKKRITNLPARQTIVAATNGLDVLASTTNQNTFLDKLNQLIWRTRGANALFMNEFTYLNIEGVLRRLGLYDSTQDMFGRTVPVYRGARLYNIGVKEDQATQIITSTETTGSSSVTTSIYAVAWGGRDANGADDGQKFHGIQQYPIRIKDLGELQSAPQFRTRLDWPIGFMHSDDYSLGRLSGIIWT